MDVENIIEELKKHSDPQVVKGMARFGINPDKTLGLSIPFIRKTAKTIGKDHKIATGLWDSRIHEARILAGMVDDPEKVSKEQMDSWAKGFDSWDVCDQVCMNLFRNTRFAYPKARQWADRNEEFVKRAGFALMATLAAGDKNAGDDEFIKFFEAIKKHSVDNRNYVKKAVNWALRQIGKRNIRLNKLAVETALQISKIDSKAATWIASDALKELQSKNVLQRLGRDG